MLLAIDLAGNFSLGNAIIAGLIGGVAMLPVIYSGRAIGMTRMDLLKTLGTMLMPRAEANRAYVVGLMVHLMMSAGFGVVHAGLLHAFDPSSTGAATGLGVLFGALHGLLVTMVMPMMLKMRHPLVKSGEMNDPGPFMTGMGKMTPMGMVMGHVAFAVVAGAVYASLAG